MPILPPRNLPLSPKTGGSGSGNGAGAGAGAGGKKTTSSQNRVTAKNQAGHSATTSSPRSGKADEDPVTPSKLRSVVHSASSPSTPSTGSPLASQSQGQLGRQDETTFHRRLRTLLYDHRAARDAWEDVVSIEGAKSVAGYARLAAQLDDLIAKDGAKLPESYAANLPAFLHLTQTEADARTASDVARILAQMQEERDALDAVLLRIDKHANKMDVLSDAAEALLVDATRSKGDLFAFAQEAWTTWPLSRFVTSVQTLSSHYIVQTEHLRLLSKTLKERGTAAATGTASVEKAKKPAGDGDAEEEEEEEEGEGEGKKARKARALVRQRVMEEWQFLPFLHGVEGGQDAQWFDDICLAEVGRWDE